jgi:hypothetical protein
MIFCIQREVYENKFTHGTTGSNKNMIILNLFLEKFKFVIHLQIGKEVWGSNRSANYLPLEADQS